MDVMENDDVFSALKIESNTLTKKEQEELQLEWLDYRNFLKERIKNKRKHHSPLPKIK